MSGTESRPRFLLWNTAGLLAWQFGQFLYHDATGVVSRVGLWFCGLSGSFDGKADNYR